MDLRLFVPYLAYRSGDLNPYALRHLILSQACLPFHHTGLLAPRASVPYPSLAEALSCVPS